MAAPVNLPEGFELDEQSSLPEGFVLDSTQSDQTATETPEARMARIADEPGIQDATVSDAMNVQGVGALGRAGVGVGAYLAKKFAGGAGDAALALGRRALGMQKSVLNKVGLDKANKAVRTAYDEGVISPLASVDDMVARNASLEQKSVKGIGGYLRAQKGGMDLDKASRAIDATRPQFKGGLYDRAHGVVDTALDTVKAHGQGPISFEQANSLKGTLQDAVNWTDTTLVARAGRQTAGAMRGSIDDQLEAVAANSDNTAGFQQFLKDKSTYGDTQVLEGSLKNRLNAEAGNDVLGFKETLAGAGALASGNPAAIGAVAATKLGNKFGSTLVGTAANSIAKTADKVARVLQVAPQYAQALSGPTAKVNSALFLLQQNDPEFRRLYNEQPE